MSDDRSYSPADPLPHVNEVRLRGRVSAEPEERTMPSGDALVTLRVVVDRPPRRDDTGRRVDVVDVACWTRRTQRSAGRLVAGDTVEVEGSLRRRFYAAGTTRSSRYEVEASRVARLARVATARSAKASASG